MPQYVIYNIYIYIGRERERGRYQVSPIFIHLLDNKKEWVVEYSYEWVSFSFTYSQKKSDIFAILSCNDRSRKEKQKKIRKWFRSKNVPWKHNINSLDQAFSKYSYMRRNIVVISNLGSVFTEFKMHFDKTPQFLYSTKSAKNKSVQALLNAECQWNENVRKECWALISKFKNRDARYSHEVLAKSLVYFRHVQLQTDCDRIFSVKTSSDLPPPPKVVPRFKQKYW
jgi:hypothetical protein